MTSPIASSLFSIFSKSGMSFAHKPALDSPDPTKISSFGPSDASGHPRQNEKALPHSRPIQRSLVQLLWRTIFLPIIAFAYLGFCYAAATRVIPVHVYNINNPVDHLFSIKAGVTTINIILIGMALLPLRALLSDLKSEEFFRVLHNSKSKGVPLKAVNNVSSPSRDLMESLSSITRNTSSKYYSTAILAGLFAVMISSLAPAALSVGLILVEGDMTAIEVGAVAPRSIYQFDVLNGFSSGANVWFNGRIAEAAAMGWVQTVLGKNIPFLPTSSQYGVPVPLRVDPTARARYLTDVIVLDPVCNWTIPNPPATISKVDNITSLQAVNITLPDHSISATYNGLSNWDQNKSVEVIGSGDFGLVMSLKNTTTGDAITDGSMAWIVAQLTSGQQRDFASSTTDTSVLDLSGIPTQDISYNSTTTSISNQTMTSVRFSVLVCKPRAAVETREVRLDGNGGLEVSDRRGLTRQGNLDDGQVSLLLGKSLAKYTTDSGPDTGYEGIGKAGQVRLFFGPNFWNWTATPVLKPLPLQDITSTYRSAVQASMTSYLSGKISTSFVPGRIQSVKLVFTSSLPHVIVSTVLFGIVTIWIIVCYFRPHAAKFTLVSVAAVLGQGSNVVEVCDSVSDSDEVAFKHLKNRGVRLEDRNGLGSSLTLHIL
ncbi:hypothetical protein E1B28_013169 [Marasmius oreades]|uniref:Uncharacterized protein n=1 Tax=Marasmius oreades TaxID=181124 RepID=A0A9P7RPW9_9AGAR|nr:uncharacterized protein E1B28_013169 [Marasmius oreades]KAG7087188.1 hypothetical protein E1B28_013169 [Marasmius oreades]